MFHKFIKKWLATKKTVKRLEKLKRQRYYLIQQYRNTSDHKIKLKLFKKLTDINSEIKNLAEK